MRLTTKQEPTGRRPRGKRPPARGNKEREAENARLLHVAATLGRARARAILDREIALLQLRRAALATGGADDDSGAMSSAALWAIGEADAIRNRPRRKSLSPVLTDLIFVVAFNDVLGEDDFNKVWPEHPLDPELLRLAADVWRLWPKSGRGSNERWEVIVELATKAGIFVHGAASANRGAALRLKVDVSRSGLGAELSALSAFVAARTQR